MKNVIDIAGYQAVWFAAVIGASHGIAWAGPAAACVFAAWHFRVSAQRARELALALTGVACGLLLDGGLARAGWVSFAATWPAPLEVLGAPPWILALWAVFPLTLMRSLAVLQRRPAWAAVFGAVGAPLAYAGAARGWAVWTSHVPLSHALAVIGAGWAIALPLLARIARGPRIEPAAAPWGAPG